MSALTTLSGRVLSALRMGRPHFLIGGLLLHSLGVAMAQSSGAPLKLPALIWGQLAITCIQLMTHYCNDYFDLPADLANPTPTHWSGGSRVLPNGLLAPRVALRVAIALAMCGLGAALVLALIVRTGAWTLPLLMLALGLAWAYSAPPLRLHSRGLGELTTALLVAGMTPLVGFYLQTSRLGLPLLGVIPLCCLQFAMLLTIEFPDRVGDAAVGKRTLVVRLGAAGAARLLILVVLAAYAVLPLLVGLGLPARVAASVATSAPVAAWQGWRVWRGAWADVACWNSLGFWAIALLMGTATAELLAFLLGSSGG
jgi:1,4-dihydroxy-2-naphthoate polyprenyltransferase